MITYFSSSSRCLSHYNNTPWAAKAFYVLQSYATLLTYAVNRLLANKDVVAPYMAPRDFSKHRLIVCLHGLGSHPIQFTSFVQQRHDLSNADLYIPELLNKGFAPLDDLIKPLFDIISKWAHKEGEKELVLIGISNGGLTALGLKAAFTNSSTGNVTQIRFVSIAGACNGSSWITLAQNIGIAGILPPKIRLELAPGSPRLERLPRQLQRGWEVSPHIKSYYTFFAAPHDWKVPNFDSTLMHIPSANAQYALIPGHGHNSIVDRVAKAIAQQLYTAR